MWVRIRYVATPITARKRRNPVNQAVAVGMLRRLGYRVDVAGDGEEALRRLDRTACDLVLMDCQMPVLDGYATTARLRASASPHRAVPVVALTANAMAGDAERCLAAGMDDYLSKPIRIEALREVLERWLPPPTEPGRAGGEPAPKIAAGTG
jgi:CheY-like chemotaxis protein